MAERTTMAPSVPQTMAFLRSRCGRLRAAKAMTIALSPASTRSMRMMASSADHQPVEKNSISSTPSCVDQQPDRRCGEPGDLAIAANHKHASTEPGPGFVSKVLLGMESCRYMPGKPEAGASCWRLADTCCVRCAKAGGSYSPSSTY